MPLPDRRRCTAERTSVLPLLCLLAGVSAPPHVRGTEPAGTWRERFRQRLLERNQEPPEASTDLSARIERPGDYTFAFEHGGRRRLYRVHVPARYSPAKPAPLLLALHGGGGDMSIQAEDRYYGLITKSEAVAFVVAFPNGFSRFPSGRIATWNAGRCCGAARDEGVDDVGFIREVVRHVSEQLAIDPHRVYAAGMSNGGMMAYRLACELAGTVRAVASVAGTDNTVACHPARPVPVLHIHALDDDHVLFGGGAGATFRDPALVTDFTSVPATVAKWTAIDRCSPTPRRVLEVPGAHCDRYEGCQGGASVELCVTTTGGHSWPGGTKPRYSPEPPSHALSATDVMWEFFDAVGR